MKKYIPFLLIAAVAAGAVIIQGCTTNAKELRTKRVGDTIPVRTVELQPTEVSKAVRMSGRISADDETTLSFKTGGVIGRILVNEGDAVRKGQLLATLDLTEINAQVKQANLGLEKAKRDFDRVQRLYADSVATLEQLQNTRTALDVAEQQNAIASFNHKYSEIRAASDGFVLRKFANEGQIINPGTAVFLTNNAQKGKWKLTCGASDVQWAAIHVGDPATLSIDAFPGRNFTGRVSRKAESADPASGAFSIEVTLTDNQQIKLASGMFGTSIVTPSSAASFWRIPFDALMDGDGGNGYVFVTNDGKTAEKVVVSIAGIEKDVVQIDKGLANTKWLIVSGSAYLTDGSPIRIVQ